MPEKKSKVPVQELPYSEGYDEYTEPDMKGSLSSDIKEIREYRPGDRLARTLHKIVGLEMDEVSRILCLQPAELIGMEKEIGSIEAGKKADLVVCNDNIDIKEVYIGGKAIM